MKKIFMDRCPKDEISTKNLVGKKAMPIPEDNLKNLFRGGSPPLAIEQSRKKICTEN